METRPPTTEDFIHSAMNRARSAFVAWSQTPLEKRLNVLTSIRHTIVAEQNDIASELAALTGKTRVEALLNEIFPTLSLMRYYEKNAAEILRPNVFRDRVSFPGSEFSSSYSPLGVALVVSPWNYPFGLSMSPLITALAAGNSVILKPSELTSGLSEIIERIFQRQHTPPHLVQCVNGDGETAQRLIEEKPTIIALTGSVQTGKKIMEAASRHLIPVILELGGKDPMIVFEDADLERAANGAVYGAFANAGQICVSVERLYVQESVYEDFAARVAEKAAALRVGATDDHDIGAMISPRQIETFKDHLEDARKKGAHLSKEPMIRDLFVEPVVLTEVDHSMKIMTEETFAPSLPVMKFSTEEEVVALANASPYGLNASVWTRDLKKGRRVAAQLITGNCAVNDVIKNIGHPRQPFGGVKESGMGRLHGPDGLKAFSRQMSLMVNNSKIKREINWFPYSAEMYDHLMIFIRFLFGSSKCKPKWMSLMRTFRYFRKQIKGG